MNQNLIPPCVFEYIILTLKLSDCRGCRSYKEDDISHYNVLSGMSSDTVDAVRSAIPMGLKF